MTFRTQPSQPFQPSPALRAAIGERLLIADGAMGSMLQGCPITLDEASNFST
jgi:methionine synthase I (cobalamin-dependent)